MTRTTAQWIIPILCIAGLTLAVSAFSRQPPPLEIRLEARDMAFYLAGQVVPNPILQVEAGQLTKLILINKDRGMLHDWAVDRLGIFTEVLPGDGSTGAIEFRSPDLPGKYEYVCSLHDRLMRGWIEVVE